MLFTLIELIFKNIYSQFFFQIHLDVFSPKIDLMLTRGPSKGPKA